MSDDSEFRIRPGRIRSTRAQQARQIRENAIGEALGRIGDLPGVVCLFGQLVEVIGGHGRSPRGRDEGPRGRG